VVVSSNSVSEFSAYRLAILEQTRAHLGAVIPKIRNYEALGNNFRNQYGDGGFCADGAIYWLRHPIEAAGLTPEIPRDLGIGRGTSNLHQFARENNALRENGPENPELWQPGDVLVMSNFSNDLLPGEDSMGRPGYDGHTAMVLSVEEEPAGSGQFRVTTVDANHRDVWNSNGRSTVVVEEYLYNPSESRLMDFTESDGYHKYLAGVIDPDQLPQAEAVNQHILENGFSPEEPWEGYLERERSANVPRFDEALQKGNAAELSEPPPVPRARPEIETSEPPPVPRARPEIETSEPPPVPRARPEIEVRDSPQPEAVPAVAPNDFEDYTVKPGDNIWKIAQREYGLTETEDINPVVEDIKRLNNLSDEQADLIIPGQSLKLPVAGTPPQIEAPSMVSPLPVDIVHIVEGGDTLSKIAEEYYGLHRAEDIGKAVQEIAEANGIDNSDLIFKGDPLTIPDASFSIDPAIAAHHSGAFVGQVRPGTGFSANPVRGALSPEFAGSVAERSQGTENTMRGMPRRDMGMHLN